MHHEEEKYSILYQQLVYEMLEFHRGNRRRLRRGLRSLLIVPLLFLVLLFLTEESRVIFLLLWIISMFGIAAYLIGVEYIDSEMQKRLCRITDLEEQELSEIFDSDEEESRRAMQEHLLWLKSEIRTMRGGHNTEEERQ